MRGAALGAAAVLVLLACSLLLVERAARAPAAVLPAPEPAVVAQAPAPRPVAIAAPPAAPTPPPASDAAQAAPATSPRVVVPRPAGRALRKLVRRQLASGELRASLARCAGAPGRRGAPAILVLDVEARDGEVRIVDCAVQSPGGASAAAVSCAQAALRGRVLEAPAARPGDRARMPFALASWQARR